MNKRLNVIILTAFIAGFCVDRIYMHYKMNNTIKTERELWKKYVNDNETFNFVNILNNSYGTIVISSMNKDKSRADDDILMKINLAKVYKWSMIGEKKIENVNGYYKVSQTAFRLFIP